MNKIIPVAVAALFVILGFVLYLAVSDSSEPDAGLLPVSGGPPVPDTGEALRDDSNETLRTITEMQERLQQNFETQSRENKEMLDAANQENQALREQLDELKQSLSTTLDERLSQLQDTIPDKPSDASFMPPGIGYDDYQVGAAGNEPGYAITPPANEYVSVVPVSGSPGDAPAKGGLLGGVSSMVGGLLDSASKPLAGVNSSAAAKKAAVKPAYTINNQATLVANTTMTALMGKVPNKNNVVDPFRFKVITRGENLAASGLRLPPGIEEIVSSGYSVGNREMSCVRGWIDTVTLVFQDGTISTTTTRKNTNNPKSVKSLGYISDPWGKPCINGKLFSNADDYLTDRAFMATLAAVSDAAASAETSTLVRGDSFVSAITGDKGDYVLGKSVSGFSEELLAYFRDRMANAFDVVFIPTGIPLSIHIEEEIQFDYDPNGRMIDHGFSLQASKSRQFD